MEYVFIWIGLTIVITFLGASRKIGSTGAFLISFFLSPLVGFIVVLFSERAATEKDEQEMQGRNSILNPELQQEMDNLYAMKDLLDKGVITEEEFDAQKRKILGDH